MSNVTFSQAFLMILFEVAALIKFYIFTLLDFFFLPGLIALAMLLHLFVFFFFPSRMKAHEFKVFEFNTILLQGSRTVSGI